MPEERWTEIWDIVQEAVTNTILNKGKRKKAKQFSKEVLKRGEKGRETKGIGEKESYTNFKAEFQE